jgi:hypothetical protein
VRRRCFLGRAIEIRHVSRRDGDDPKGGVISVSDTSTPLQSKRRCAPRPFAQTAALETQESDMVFTQYEPVLRGKGQVGS